jgi:hypothetical protein
MVVHTTIPFHTEETERQPERVSNLLRATVSGSRYSNLVSHALLTLSNTHLESIGIDQKPTACKARVNSSVERKHRQIEKDTVHAVKSICLV